jgi:hypothetical protein
VYDRVDPSEDVEMDTVLEPELAVWLLCEYTNLGLTYVRSASQRVR